MSTTADPVEPGPTRRRARALPVVPLFDQSVGRLLKALRPAEGIHEPSIEARDRLSYLLTPQAAAGLISQLVVQQRRTAQSWNDPLRTLREMDSLAVLLATSLAELQADLPHAVRALRRHGLSFKEIAAESGLPVGRVIELARESRALGLTR